MTKCDAFYRGIITETVFMCTYLFEKNSFIRLLLKIDCIS